MYFALVFALTLQTDSIRMGPEAYLDRVLSVGPDVVAASLRSEAAVHAARQAGAWSNPHLTASVDNIGAQTEVTGLSGARGLEGQAVFTFLVPLGGDLAGARMQGEALADEAGAMERLTRLRAVSGAVDAVARAQRDARLRAFSSDELLALEQLAETLGAQALAGRAAEGDAARARLAHSVALEAFAMRSGAAAASAVEVALRGGLEPTVEVRIDAPLCRPGQPLATGEGSPRVEAAQARVRQAEGAERLARGLRVPDLQPQVGLRRVAGVEALYAGLAFDLPLFDRGSRRVQAAVGTTAATRAAAADEDKRIMAELAAARADFQALDAAGSAFRAPEWEADVARMVEASRARLDLGEGSLMELLDVRRARLQALEARERWGAAWRSARARVAELEGRESTADLFCDPLIREDR